MARSSLSVNAAIILVVAMVSITYQHASGVQNQAEMYKAAAKSYAGADTDLNQAYIRLSKALEPEPRAKLKKAELAWLKFRDAEGEFRASEFKGGAMQPMARLGYLEDLTRRRSQELKNAYKQFVAD